MTTFLVSVLSSYEGEAPLVCLKYLALDYPYDLNKTHLILEEPITGIVAFSTTSVSLLCSATIESFSNWDKIKHLVLLRYL